MRKLRKQNLSKKIIYIIIVLMLCNFIIPNYSYAVSTESGGAFLEVIAQFICFIPDVVIGLLQNMFVATDSIYDNYDDKYKILYSPGIIFAGEIPAFDINFIDPNSGDKLIERVFYANSYDGNICIEEAVPRILSKFGYTNVDSNIMNTIDKICSEIYIDEDDYLNAKEVYFTINNVKYTLGVSAVMDFRFSFYLTEEQNEWPENRSFNLSYEFLDKEDVRAQNIAQFKLDLIKYFGVGDNDDESENLKNLLLEKYDEIYSTNLNIYTTNITFKSADGKDKQIFFERDLNGGADYYYTIYSIADTGEEVQSSARILQPIIAGWYNALRRVAIVGLLSVLLYIGIRIALTSTSAKDKAKYKNMLKDWLVALCLLFALHYIMSLTITVVGEINNIIGASAIGPEGEDVLMSSLRNKIVGDESAGWGTVVAYVVIYCTLAVYTVIFTIQYIKRTIYIAFLTVIAPLITLTYPLDKIKDGKSQAFDMWIKDYVFFVLIQVVHLLLYYIFLSSSMNLAHQGNWIYAIVAIGFLTKAEKIMKKMFGFEKSNSMGAMAAGATGALVTNAISKISHFGGAKSSGGASGASGGSAGVIRTASTNPIQGLIPGTGTSNSTPPSGAPTGGSGESGGGGTPGASTPGANTPSPVTPVNGNNNKQKTSSPSTSRTNSKNKPTSKNSQKQSGTKTSSKGNKLRPNIIKGATTLFGRYAGSIAKGTLKVLLGGTGAIIGFSAGVAQGDLGKSFAGLIGGAKAGSNLASNAVDTAKKLKDEIPEKAHEFADTYREGAYGVEYANNVKFDREFRRSPEYKKLKENNTNFSDKKIQQMLDEGISDAKQMDKILKNNKKHPRKYTMVNSIKYSQMAAKCKTKILYDKKSFIRFCQDQNITDLSDDNLEKIRKCIIDFK